MHRVHIGHKISPSISVLKGYKKNNSFKRLIKPEKKTYQGSDMQKSTTPHKRGCTRSSSSHPNTDWTVAF